MTASVSNVRTLAQLVDAGLVSPDKAPELQAVVDRYALSVTPGIAAQLAELPGDGLQTDPVATQFIPDARELNRLPEELDDPIGDDLKTEVPGLVHRYRDRVLLKLVSVCPVYCRFCFRRESVGSGQSAHLSKQEFADALDYISGDTGIWEVILTGGDPLILSPRRIAEVTEALSRIPHVKVLRWHTRVPVVMPEHVTPELVAAMQCPGKTIYVGLHSNHVRELTPEARAASTRLIDGGVAMVSQTVLLRGINDDADTLCDLMRAFVETRIKPYYLHHPDLAPGTSHFRVSIAEGQRIVGQMRERLSGLALPTYVLDIPGAHGKVPIGPAHIVSGDDGSSHTVFDARGGRHAYRDICAGPFPD